MGGNAFSDVIYLKKGSIIEEKISGIIPGEQYKIKTGEGNIFVFGEERVKKIEFEEEMPKQPLFLAQGVKGELKIDSLFIENIFPSRYKFYAQEPVGRLRLKNDSRKILSVKVSFFVPDYMDLPTESEHEIKDKTTIDIPLMAIFNRKIFEIDEDIPTQAEIRIIGDGQERKCIQPITILSRNTIDWRESENITSFVTLNDSVIVEFTKLCIPSFRDKDLDVLGSRLQDAMAIYAALGSVTYLPDPNMPYKKVAGKKIVVDKVQYPRETLKYRKGDCEDLAVLYASCLEAMGIKTAFVLIPQHIFIIFNTGVSERNKELISYDETSYIVRNGYVWLPVEITRLQDTFLSNIKEEMDEYRKYLGKIEIIDVQKGWERFAPVALPPTDFYWEEDKTLAENRLKETIVAFKNFRKMEVDSLIVALKEKIEKYPLNLRLRNQLGIVFGKEGKLDLAENEFKGVLKIDKLHPSSLNNLGNIYLLRGSPTEAILSFKQAEGSDPDDGGILFNLAIALFLKEDMESALKVLGESIKRFRDFNEAVFTLGFPEEEVALSLTGKPKISREEINRLLKEVLEKIPEGKEAKERAKRTFAIFAGTRGAEISKQDDLSSILYWKE